MDFKIVCTVLKGDSSRVPTHLENLKNVENCWKFVNLENSWNFSLNLEFLV